MKERKHYEVPSITVISMDAENDIIQTSGATGKAAFSNITQTTTYAGGLDIQGLFATTD